MYPKDPIELFKASAVSTLGRCGLLMAFGGVATLVGGLCAVLDPSSMGHLTSLLDLEMLFSTIILLPVTWLGGFFFSFGHLFGVVNLLITVMIVVKMLYRTARKRLCLLALLSVQTMATFLASPESHWLGWAAVLSMCLGFAGLFCLALIWPRLNVGRLAFEPHPGRRPDGLEIATHRWR